MLVNAAGVSPSQASLENITDNLHAYQVTKQECERCVVISKSTHIERMEEKKNW